MARVAVCGFEMGDTSELTTPTGTYSIVASPVRSGNYALRVNPTGSATGKAEIGGRAAGGAGTTLNLATAYHAFYFQYATKPASGSEEIMAVPSMLGSRKFSIRLTSGGVLQAYDSTGTTQLGSDGTTVLVAGQWYLIEAMVGTGAAGSYAVRINLNVELSGTGSLTTSNNQRLQLGKVQNRNSQDVDFFYDDVRIDSAGYPGPARIARMDPDGAGDTTQWTGTYADVDEIPHDSDTTYLTTSNSGDVELVSLESANSAGIGGKILTVVSCAVCRDEGGASQLKVRLKTDTGTNNTSNVDMGTSYALYAQINETDPGTGAAWLIGALNTMQVGVVANAAVAHRCTALCAMVEFQPFAVRSMRHRHMQGMS